MSSPVVSPSLCTALVPPDAPTVVVLASSFTTAHKQDDPNQVTGGATNTPVTTTPNTRPVPSQSLNRAEVVATVTTDAALTGATLSDERATGSGDPCRKRARLDDADADVPRPAPVEDSATETTVARRRTRCVLDVETTGLPIRTGLPFDAYPPYTDLAKYDTCRVVRVSWVVLDVDVSEGVETRVPISAHTFVVKPDDFRISRLSERFHGITHERAVATGRPFASIAAILNDSVRACDVLIAHNLSFDKNIMLSELFRAAATATAAEAREVINNACTETNTGAVVRELIEKLTSMEEWCTMKHGQREFGGGKSPRLDELVSLVHARGTLSAPITSISAPSVAAFPETAPTRTSNIDKCVWIYQRTATATPTGPNRHDDPVAACETRNVTVL